MFPLSKMAIPYLNFIEKSFNIHKFKKYPKNSSTKLKPLWPILLSIFLYFAVFYVFRFSPPTLVCTTKFWFFISNTLIIMIAADFDAFSSPEKQECISQEYYYEIKNDTLNVAFKTTLISPPSAVSSATEGDYHDLGPETKEKEIENYVIKQEDDNAENPEGEREEILKDSSTTDQDQVEDEGCSETEEKGVSLWESPPDHVGARFEEDEFSSMSIEELNTRVEEFIRRIHRQIRLQVLDNQRV